MAAKREKLRTKLCELGFDEVRFAAAGEVPEQYRERFREWLREGRQADMAWIDRSLEKRLDLEKVLPGVESVILLGVNYLPSEAKAREQTAWAKYALYQDYHHTIREALAAAGRLLEAELELRATDYRYYVDTGPVLERGWAARSGLGWQGKNGMLISRRHGNWLFLAAILVRRSIVPDPPLAGGRHTGGSYPEVGELCGTCTRCMDACPTRAIVEPGLLDARLCISYQTIENKGIIPRELRSGIGTRIYGCDICLDVCPWNRFAEAGRRHLLSARYDVAELSLEEILGMSRDDFSRVFARTAIKRLKWRGLLRNACVVAGNLRERLPPADEEEISRLQPLLVRLAAHDEPVVRAHAVWAVSRLWPGAVGALLHASRSTESDAAVLDEYSYLESAGIGCG